MKTRLLGAMLAAVFLTGCGAARQAASTMPVSGSSSNSGASVGGGFEIQSTTPAPSFLLPDQHGRPIGPQLFRGRWAIVTFLYTHCPDVCPLIANQLAAAQRADRGLRVVAVSVDPRRDTPTAVLRFLHAHRTGANFHYVVGTRAALAKVWRSYHIAALPGPNGTISHSSFSVLVDPTGHERVLFDSQVTARGILTALHSLA